MPSILIVSLLATALALMGACAHAPSPAPSGPASATVSDPAAAAAPFERPAAASPHGRGASSPFVETSTATISAPPAAETRAPGRRADAAPPDPARRASVPSPASASAFLGETEPRTPSENPDTGGITLNFDDADLYEVIRTMAAILGINYIVDPNVRGRVTIQTAGTLRRGDLLAVFYQILEVNGLTAIQDGPIHRITSLKEAPRMSLPARYGADPTQTAPGERVMVQIIPLQHIKAAEMTKLLTPFVSADATILADADSNTLLVVDKQLNIQKALRLVENFDIDLYEGVTYRFFRIKNVYVKEIVPIIESVFAAYPAGFRSDVKLIPIERLNTLLVMSQQARHFDKVVSLLETLDAPSEGTQSQIFVYSVRNGEAGDLAGLLERIFGTGPTQVADRRTAEMAEGGAPRSEARPPANPFMMGRAVPSEAEAPPAAPAARLSADSAPGTLRGEIRIIPDTTRNLLIIEALPADWHIIQAVLDRLDVLARQVLIEAMIAEISLDDSIRLGLEWAYQEGSGRPRTTLLGAVAGAAGLQYVIGQTNRWTMTLNALASDNRVNILSSPTVLASNEKQARIDISTEVPVASASYRYGGTTEGSVLQTTIEYRNTGIILTVTPYINENGMVTMDISQEVSEQAGDVVVGDQTYPSFFKRSVTTNLTVGNDQTIVIGGLIRENQSRGRAGVPFFSKVPILGYLFGRNTQSGSKTELIILITPRVIVNLADVDAVTEDFSNKVQRVRYPAEM